MHVIILQKKPRGPYRQGKKIPRQTLHNRMKRLRATNVDSGLSEGTCSVLETKSDVCMAVEDVDSIITAPDSLSDMDQDLDSPPESNQDESLALCSISTESEAEDEKLYEGSSLTLKSGCSAINTYILKHHLSKQAQMDLLSLQQSLLPTCNRLPRTLYHFQKMVNFGSDSVEFHYYCPICFTPASDEASVCSNHACSAPVGNNYFIVLPISSQLKKLLSSMFT